MWWVLSNSIKNREERKKDRLRQLEKEKERQKIRDTERSGKLSGREIERQREDEARRLEREKLKIAEEKFKNYTPDVKIEYRDEFGRLLNQKEVSCFQQRIILSRVGLQAIGAQVPWKSTRKEKDRQETQEDPRRNGIEEPSIIRCCIGHFQRI